MEQLGGRHGADRSEFGWRRTAARLLAGFFALAALAGVWSARAADAEQPLLLSLRSATADFTPDFSFDPTGGGTFAEVETLLADLASGDAASFDLGILDFGELLDVPVTWDDSADALGDHVIAFTTEAPLDLLPPSSPFAGQDAQLLVLLDWSDATSDPAPDVVVALKVASANLGDLFADWAEIPGLPGQALSIDDLIIPLTQVPGTALDPAQLPSSVLDFFDVGEGPLDEALTLDSVMNLVGQLDLASTPMVQHVADFLGVDVTDVVELAGSVADGAALLFDSTAATNPADFAIDGPVEIDQDDLPAWLVRRIVDETSGAVQVPEFRFRYQPGATPGDPPTASLQVHDTVAVAAGPGEPQILVYDIEIADMVTGSGIAVDVAAPTFHLPYGVGDLFSGALTDVQLHLELDSATDVYSGAFRAGALVGSQPSQLQVTIDANPAATRALASLTGAIPAGDIVGWLSGGAFPDGDFGDVSFATAEVNDVEFSYDASGDTQVFGLYSTISGIEAFSADLRTRLLVGVEHAAATKVLTALRVDDESCSSATGACIHLSDVLPLPGPDGELAVDVQLPAVNFYSLLPSGATFDNSKLGTNARTFLGEVLAQEPLIQPTSFDADATFATDLPITALDPFFTALSITDIPDTVRLQGGLSFSLSDLGSDLGELDLTKFQVEASLGGISAAPFAGFPEWMTWPDVSTGEWTAYLKYVEGATEAEDQLSLGASIEGIDIGDIGDPLFDPPPFTLEAAFSGSPASDIWAITARASLDDPWVNPFGIEWLDIDDLFAEIRLDRPEGASEARPSALLGGAFTLCDTQELAVDIDIDPGATTLQIALLTQVTPNDILSCAFPGASLELPGFIGAVGVGPGSLTVRIADGHATVDVLGGLEFHPYEDPATAEIEDPRDPISLSLFAGAGISLDTFELEHLTFGVRPDSEIGLSRFLPPDVALELPLVGPQCAETDPVAGIGCDYLDFVVVPEVPEGETPTSGLGFAFSFAPGGGDIPLAGFSDAAKEWFAPLFGGDVEKTATKSLKSGFGLLGAFGLPEPLNVLATSLGFEPNILASGTLPIPGIGGGDPTSIPPLALTLAFEVSQELLAQIDFVDALAVELSLLIDPDDLRLSIALGLDGRVRLLQGIHPDALTALDDLVAGMTDALTGETTSFDFGAFAAPSSTSADAPCPRGGVRAKASTPFEDDTPSNPEYFCFDLLDLAVGGEVGFEAPSKLFVALEGSITSVAAAANPLDGWAPMGFDDVLIREIKGRIELGVDPSKTPTPVSLIFSLLVNGEAFGKTMAGAVQAGVNLGLTTTPIPAPIVRPTIESFGLMLSLPDGLSTGDLLDLHGTVAGAISGEPPDEALLDNLPNVGVRDLYLSISPLGVDRLCIAPGLSLKGDLYVPNEIEPVAEAPPVCGENGTPPDPPTNDCLAKREEGCVASLLFSLTPSGLIAEGTVAAMDLSPIGIAFTDDLEVIFRLTTEEQVIRLAGAVEVGAPAIPGPIIETWAEGRLAIEMDPFEWRFAGELNAFGFHVLADGVLGLGDGDPLALLAGEFGPEFGLHVVLGAPDLSAQYASAFGGTDFSDAVTPLVVDTLDELVQFVEFLDDLLASFVSDPLGTLLDIPDLLVQAGVPVDPEIASIVQKIEDGIALFNAKKDEANEDALLGNHTDVSPTFSRILNGFTYGGLEGYHSPSKRTCVAGIKIDDKWLTTFVWNPLEPISADNPSYLKGWEDDDGRCWTIPFVSRGFWTEPQCIGVKVDGGCWWIPPFQVGGICSTLFPGPDGPASAGSPSGSTCTVTEVKNELDELVAGLLSSVLDLGGSGAGGLPDADPLSIVEGIRDYLAAPDGRLAALDCAEFRIDIQAFDESEALLAIEGALFGLDIELGVLWEFALADLLDLDPGGANLLENTEHLIADFWRFLTEPQDVSCTGVDPEFFGEDGIDYGTQLQYTAADGGEPPPPPPPALGLSLSSETIDENGAVTATVSFNRPLSAEDGARSIGIDWDRDGLFAADETLAIGVGGQSATATRTYRDDDPSLTTADTYTVEARDTTGTGGSDTAVITVRNVAPAVTAELASVSIDEGGTASLAVTWTDAGPDDTHDLRILWGDGSPATVVTGAHSGASYDHVYLDDDPSVTASDDYVISVQVTDDDRGVGRATRTTTVHNVAPSTETLTLSPTTVEEGDLATFTIDFDDVGTRDTHQVDVDFDGDGTYELSMSTEAGATSTEVSHLFVDDDPTATPQDDVQVGIRIADDDGGVLEQQRTVTVRNVAPRVCGTVDPAGFPEVDPEADASDEVCFAATSVTIDEGGTATVSVGFQDQGLADTHIVRIDWGDPSIPDTVFGEEGGEPFPVGSRTVTATATFGDNGTFPVGVTVTDDDDGEGTAAFSVVVDNVDPTVTIAEPASVAEGDGGTVLADGPDDGGALGVATFLVRAGSVLDLLARALDPGSDDLAFTWDWDATDRFDKSSTSTVDRVNPPGADPFPSPTVQPRDVTGTAAHAWSQACLYEVGLVVGDDDAGTGTDTTWVVVTGTDDRLRRPGWWYNQYDFEQKRNRNDISSDTATCYLEVVRHMSRVFDTYRDASTRELAREVLNTRKSSNAKDIMVRQLLATWLNVAHGSQGWFDPVDVDGDGIAETPFHMAIAQAEAVRLDPTTTRDELLAWEGVLERINGE